MPQSHIKRSTKWENILHFLAKKNKKLAQACSLVCHHRQSSRTLAHRILFLTRYVDLLKDRGTMMIKMRIGILSRLVRGASLSACPNPGRNMSIPIFEIEKLDPILVSDHIFKKISIGSLSDGKRSFPGDFGQCRLFSGCFDHYLLLRSLSSN